MPCAEVLAERTQPVAVSRRAFVQRALIGAGAVAATGVALGGWARAANAEALSKGGKIAGSMAGMDMSKMDMSNGMSGMNQRAAKLRDVNSMDADQVQEARQLPIKPGGVVNMDGEFYKPVRLPAKPNAKPLLTKQQSDDLERRLSCPCPCNLDVFTCRTTDFSCGNSPAVHDDVLTLVEGGYSADEIMKAMIGVYGNNILMAPPKSGMSLIAWFGPFVALGIGAVVVNTLLRKWRRNADAAAAVSDISPARVNEYGATNEEMDRLRVALRDDK
ncbi:MAG: cytochrome c-type biogenesis protein CcmH [Gemmatimonas sp.]